MRRIVNIDGVTKEFDFPDDATDQEIDDIVNSEFSQPETQQQTQEPEQKTGILSGIRSDLAKRGQSLVENAARKESFPEYALQQTGEIAGGVGDVVARATAPVGKGIASLAQKYTPALYEAGKATGDLAGRAINKALPDLGKTLEDPSNRAETARSLGNILTLGVGSRLAAPVVKEAAVGAGKVTGEALKGINKVAGKQAAELTGIPEETLRTATSKEGKQLLKEAYGTQFEVGQELVDAIDNAWDVIPKSEELKSALKNVPYVNVVPLMSKLRTSIPTAHTAEMKSVVSKLNQKADELADMASKYGEAGNIPADRLFEFRKEIDNVIDDSWGKESGKFVSTLKDVRKDIKDELLKTAKGTEYEKTITDMAQKLDALDKIKQIVGKTSDSREMKAESVIRNINNLGKEKRREWLENFDMVFGEDFATKAKVAQMAEQMGEEGAGTWFPRWTTGRSGISKGIGLALGSPKIATNVTLPTTQKLANIGEKLSPTKNKLKNTAKNLGKILENMTDEEKKKLLGKK